MLSKYIAPGDRIDITGIRMGDDGADASHRKQSEKVYQSQIFDILSEDKLEIIMPMEKSKLVLLPIDSEYELFFYTKVGLYQCYARITDRYKSNNIYLIVMELVSNLSKYQRREFYRLNCAMDLHIRLMTEEELQGKQNNEPHCDAAIPMEEAIAVDISGGGVRCVGRIRYEEGSYVYVRFCLNLQGKYKVYTLAGIVLQVHDIESRPGEYEYRVKFDNLTTKEQEEIIRYIFDEERKYRKRERGE